MMKKFRDTITLVLFAMLLAGCGGEKVATWPSSASDDFIKVVSNKGMANVWGVAIDVAGVEDSAEASINPDATLGATAEEATGKNIVIFGKRVVTLETTGNQMLKLDINGRDYGLVGVGSRVAIDQDNNVSVNHETRKPSK